MKKIIPFVTLLFIPLSSLASPSGLWQTIDDKTGQPRSVIEISENQNQLFGVIKEIKPFAGDTGICSKCPGDFKGKKILGLQILSGVQQRNASEYVGGKILDPKSGNLYRCNMTFSQDGRSVSVRGYIGVPLLGRTQIWYKIDK